MTKRLRCAEAIVLLAAALLGNTPAQEQKGFAARSFPRVDGVKPYYDECGLASRVVVLVHDGVFDSPAWDDVWQDLASTFIPSGTIGEGTDDLR